MNKSLSLPTHIRYIMHNSWASFQSVELFISNFFLHSYFCISWCNKIQG
jgi:hypothetical protein